MKTLFTNSTIVPVRPRGVVLEGASLGIDDGTGTIVELGLAQTIDPAAYDSVVDCSGKLIIPGLVNAHCHAVQTWYRGSQERRPLELWRQYVKARDRLLTDEDIELGCLLSAVELLRSGCTSTIEHFYSTSSSACMGGDRVLSAWRQVGIRGVLAPMLSDVNFESTVGFTNMNSLDPTARAEVDQISKYETSVSVDEAASFIAERQGSDGLLTFMLGPSAPHRCSEGLIQRAHELADDLGIRWHMHVAETGRQFESSVAKTGQTPLGRLSDLGVLSSNCSLAHLNHCTDDDLDLLVASGASAVHNPISNMKIGAGRSRVPEMLARGVNVALGTDGASTNDSQSVLEVMKVAALFHSSPSTHHRDWLSALDVLDMGTISGAIANGTDKEVGSLEVGKQADLVIVGPCSALIPLSDPIKQLVYTNWEPGIESVYVNGHQQVRGHEVIGLDIEDLYRRVLRRFSELRAQFEASDRQVKHLEAELEATLYPHNIG